MPMGHSWRKNIKSNKERQNDHLPAGEAMPEERGGKPAWFASHNFTQLKPAVDVMGTHQPAGIKADTGEETGRAREVMAALYAGSGLSQRE